MKNVELLDYQTAEKLGGALHRLAEIGTPTIITKEIEAERAGLQRFINEEAPKHLIELLGCWFTIRREYEPLLNTISMVANRVKGILHQTAAIRQAQQQAPAEQLVKEG